ncbi:hypothetical protein GCM10012320_16500 [Sinomonas cellulolyticus]|uniref:Septum formation initiator family protein n=1 Tax=Sinomonas cellulolyticus TaxID=2801916 RepID=A0ABS1JYM2_9MICC|nr:MULTISPECIES: septum formation initiator family protein [Sinomonas]MBL0704475.1 septum formation initiator family protein [Sinomonas cellulolyticus]GHG48892.1 hypothetical protein GCM10012320_16500 [Sinomonas sp. KCTC 49339]
MATRRPAVPRTPATKRTAPPAAAEVPVAAPPSPEPASSPSAKPTRRPRASKGPKTPLRTPVPTDDTPVPARAFSGRIVALVVVLVAITIMLAPTVRVFLDQRAEISSLQADIAAKQAEQGSLKDSISRWQDPNYVKQQARDRINMVMPGETSYWVFGQGGGVTAGTGGSSPVTPDSGGDKPWAQGFWDSLTRAATE